MFYAATCFCKLVCDKHLSLSIQRTTHSKLIEANKKWLQKILQCQYLCCTYQLQKANSARGTFDIFVNCWPTADVDVLCIVIWESNQNCTSTPYWHLRNQQKFRSLKVNIEFANQIRSSQWFFLKEKTYAMAFMLPLVHFVIWRPVCAARICNLKTTIWGFDYVGMEWNWKEKRRIPKTVCQSNQGILSI